MIQAASDLADEARRDYEYLRLRRTVRAHRANADAMALATRESDYANEVCRILTCEGGHAAAWITFAGTGGEIAARATSAERAGGATVSLPLQAGSAEIGVVHLVARDPQPFAQDELDLLAGLACDVARCIAGLRQAEASQEVEDALSRFNRASQGRELRMVELKDEVNELCREAGHPARYGVTETTRTALAGAWRGPLAIRANGVGWLAAVGALGTALAGVVGGAAYALVFGAGLAASVAARPLRWSLRRAVVALRERSDDRSGPREAPGAPPDEVDATLAEANARLSGRVAALEAVNVEVVNVQRATLNVMEDALADRHRVEALNGRLRDEIEERKQAEEALRESQASLMRAAEEEAVLLRELHHRVKNNLQIVASLLSLESRESRPDGNREGFRECQLRVEAMALVHEKLYRSETLSSVDFRYYMADLVRSLEHMFDLEPTRIAVTIDAEPLELDIDTAIPLGLILNELISNAIKHAFPEGRKGTVHLVLKREWGREPREAVLVVSDDGVGLPGDLEPLRPTTLGMTLVTKLSEQLGGTCAVESGAGTTFTIRFKEGDHADPCTCSRG